MIAYGLQGLVFCEYAVRLWPALDYVPLLHQFLASTLVGAASLLPGGIGAMEASLIALLANDGVPLTSAVAAVIAIRAVTLWFGIARNTMPLSSGTSSGIWSRYVFSRGELFRCDLASLPMRSLRILNMP